jgi:hypothetical protein
MGGLWRKQIKSESNRNAGHCRTADATGNGAMLRSDIGSENASRPMTRPMTPNACTTRNRTRRESRRAARAANRAIRHGDEAMPTK